MSIFVSDHAAARYRERVAPELTFREAKARVYRLANGAQPQSTLPADWKQTPAPIGKRYFLCGDVCLVGRQSRGKFLITTVFCKPEPKGPMVDAFARARELKAID